MGVLDLLVEKIRSFGETREDRDRRAMSTFVAEYKLSPELKKKWVAALRSGKYRQGQLQLKREIKRGNEYCCFGVLYECLGLRWGKLTGRYRALTSLSNCPADVSQVLRQVINPRIYGDATVGRYLSAHNDGSDLNGIRHWSFNEIADWVERHL